MRECDGAVIGWHEAGCSIRSRNDPRVELHEETLRNDAVHAHQLPHVALLTPENRQRKLRNSFKCKRKMFTVLFALTDNYRESTKALHCVKLLQRIPKQKKIVFNVNSSREYYKSR